MSKWKLIVASMNILQKHLGCYVQLVSCFCKFCEITVWLINIVRKEKNVLFIDPNLYFENNSKIKLTMSHHLLQLKARPTNELTIFRRLHWPSPESINDLYGLILTWENCLQAPTGYQHIIPYCQIVSLPTLLPTLQALVLNAWTVHVVTSTFRWTEPLSPHQSSCRGKPTSYTRLVTNHLILIYS